MNARRIGGMLGLALRARQAAAGMDACRILVRSGECGVLLLDGAAAENTRKRAEELGGRSGTPVVILPENLIEETTGKGNIILGIRKGSFAEQILAYAREED